MRKLILLSVVCSTAAFAQAQNSGKVGVNTAAPTETFTVDGTARIKQLPASGTASSVYTKTDGTSSTAKDQTFNATKTVVADANGVLGTVDRLPSASQNNCYASTTRNFSELGNEKGVAQIDFKNFSFRYWVNTGGGSGNHIQIRNNSNVVLRGYLTSIGGNNPGGGAYITMQPNNWYDMSGNLGWDVEAAGVYDFFTDHDTTLTVNSDMKYYTVRFMGQKRDSDSYPNVCLSVTEHR